MTSRKSYPPTDLDQLLRDTLHSKVATQTPSNRVWKRIKRLTGQDAHRPLLRSSVIVQAIALLLVLSAIQIRFPLPHFLQPTVIVIRPGMPVVVMTQEVAFVDTAGLRQHATTGAPLEFAEDKLLDAAVRRELIVLADKYQGSSLDNQPPIFVPLDTIPRDYFKLYHRSAASSEATVLAMLDLSAASGGGVIK